MFYLVHDTHIDLLPEAGYGRHTGGVCISHRLLHLLRMGVDNHLCSCIEAEDSPSTLKDVRVGQEVHDAVVFCDGHAFAVGFKGCHKLSMGQDDTLGVARSAAGIQYVGNIVIVGLTLQLLHFRLAWQVLA